jgi:hypothetical protein
MKSLQRKQEKMKIERKVWERKENKMKIVE